MTKFHLFALILLLPSSFVKADEGFYLSGIYSYQDYNLNFTDNKDYSLSLHAVGTNFGYQFSDFFATEIRFTTGIKGDHLKNSDEIELGNSYGAYLKISYPISRIYSLYGLVGIGAGKIIIGGNELSTFRGGSLGVGLTMKLNSAISASLECLYQDNNSTYDDYEDSLSGIQLGIQYLF